MMLGLRDGMCDVSSFCWLFIIFLFVESKSIQPVITKKCDPKLVEVIFFFLRAGHRATQLVSRAPPDSEPASDSDLSPAPLAADTER